MAKAAKKAATKTEANPPKKAAKTAPAPKKAAAKTAAKKAAPKKAEQNAGLKAPLKVSSTLAAVVGNDPMPRTEIIKRIWDYIKANNLQNPENKREILADDKLRPVFDGKDNVTMFELAKIVNNHVEK